jgi:LuxR family maltose regulon positive regulatory protein
MGISVLLVDDHPVFRKGLRLLLEEEPDLNVVGEAGDGREAIDMVRKFAPDVVVMDITMPNFNGIEATRHIMSKYGQTRVVALSIHSGKRFVEDMLQAGAFGYILKETAPEELVTGLRAVAQGDVFLSATITGVVVSKYVDVLSQAQFPGKEIELTSREKETLQLISEGNSDEQVASIQEVSTKTVRSTISRIMKKLGVNTVEELQEIARHGGLIEKDGDRISFGKRISDPIIGTKLHRPPIPSYVLRRERLLKELDEGRRLPLTLISAPAGYGTSTLASCWLEECDCPSAWITLDQDDNDLRGFLQYVLAAIGMAFPNATMKTQTVLEAPTMPPVSVLARYLLDDLNSIDDTLILVLDDYHHIRDEAVHNLLTELLRYPSPNMHLVLSTRRDPPLPISTFRAQGRMKEIAVSELRFRPEETALFLKKALDSEVDESAVAALDQKIEGWVTGLRLAALSLHGISDLDRLVEGMQEGFHYITEYLITEVLSKQSPTIVEYLMKTSILDRFCVPLCEAVYSLDKEHGEDEVDGQDFIAWLEMANLFVIPLDARHYWYRYHNLFQKLLKSQLESRYSSEEIAELHSQASAWFETEGLIEEAIQHALASENVLRAAELIENNRQAIHDDDNVYVLQRWMDMLPEEIKQERPILLIDQAWVLYYQFRIPLIPDLVDRAESLLGDEAEEQPLYGEIDFFRGYYSYFMGEGSRSQEHLRLSLQRIPEEHYEIRGQAEILFGLAMQMQGETEKGIEFANDTLHGSQELHGSRVTRLTMTLALIHIIDGNLLDASTASGQLVDVAIKGNFLYAKSWGLYLQGLVKFYQSDLKEAVRLFNLALEHKYILHTRASVDAMAGLTFAYQTLGQPDKANLELQHLFDYAQSSNDPANVTIAECCEARLSVMSGEHRSALQWLKRREAPAPEVMVWWLEIPAVTHCRALVAEGSVGSLKEAEMRLEEFLQANQFQHNNCQSIQIKALQAEVFDKQGRVDKALAALKGAVELAEPGGWIFPFIDLGDQMKDLLALFAEQDGATDYIGELLSAFEGEKVAADTDEAHRSAIRPSHSNQDDAVLRLTIREYEVLELMAGGLSNKEIGDRLHLSTETVKKHLYNIYQKLDAHNRTTALAIARDLGILPPR